MNSFVVFTHHESLAGARYANKEKNNNNSDDDMNSFVQVHIKPVKPKKNTIVSRLPYK